MYISLKDLAWLFEFGCISPLFFGQYIEETIMAY